MNYENICKGILNKAKKEKLDVRKILVEWMTLFEETRISDYSRSEFLDCFMKLYTKSKLMQKQLKVISCCNECGKKRYKIIREATGITVSTGTCPICKKEKGIIPASDWEYMMGDDRKWD